MLLTVFIGQNCWTKVPQMHPQSMQWHPVWAWLPTGDPITPHCSTYCLLALQGGRPPQAPRNAYRSMGASRPASPNWGPQAVDIVSAMLQKMGNLLLVLSHADTAVKGHLCRNDTLLCQFDLMQAVEPELLLKLLKSLKHLTLDPSTLPALQVCKCCQCCRCRAVVLVST